MNKKKNRLELVKAMHVIMQHMNNENAYLYWATLAVPDEPMEEDFEYIAEDDQSFRETVETFETCMKKWIKDGIIE